MRVLRIKETNYPVNEDTYYYEGGLYYYSNVIRSEAWFDFRMYEKFDISRIDNLTLSEINEACNNHHAGRYIVFEELSPKLTRKEYDKLKAVEILDQLLHETLYDEMSLHFNDNGYRKKCVDALNELFEMTK